MKSRRMFAICSIQPSNHTICKVCHISFGKSVKFLVASHSGKRLVGEKMFCLFDLTDGESVDSREVHNTRDRGGVLPH